MIVGIVCGKVCGMVYYMIWSGLVWYTIVYVI